MTWLFAPTACTDPEITRAEREQQVVAAMQRLDDDVVAVRDAVLRGRLADARAGAGRVLATLPPMPEGPPGAEAALRGALDELAHATSTAEAALAVGRITGACAGCHTGTGGHRPPWDWPRTRPAEMSRHAADADRLWVALIRPSEPELDAAVQAMELAAASPRATGIDLRVVALAREVRRARPADRPAAYGALLAVCADCHTTGRSLSVPRIEGVALPDLSAAMADHYTSALALQLAVIGDDAEWIRRSAAELSSVPADAALPPTADAFVADLRAAGHRALAADTTKDAARAAGDVLLACGACHRASGGGPRETPPPPPAEPHMAIHLYGAYWLAYGVYGPDERAWKAGAEALATASLGEPTSPAEESAEEQVHSLGARALRTTAPAERAALWSELATTCASCHRRLPTP